MAWKLLCLIEPVIYICGYVDGYFSIREYVKCSAPSQLWLKCSMLYHPYHFQQWKPGKEHKDLCHLLFHKFPQRELVQWCHQSFILLYLLLWSMYTWLSRAWGHMCMEHVEVGEERHEVGSLLPPLHGFQGFNSDHQARAIWILE